MNSALEDSTSPFSQHTAIDIASSHHVNQFRFSQDSRGDELASSASEGFSWAKVEARADGLGLETAFLKLEEPTNSTADDSNALFYDVKSDATALDLLSHVKVLDNDDDDDGLWSNTNTDLMHMLLGSQTDDIPDFSLTLDDDRFRLANIESADTLYPVPPLFTALC